MFAVGRITFTEIGSIIALSGGATFTIGSRGVGIATITRLGSAAIATQSILPREIILDVRYYLVVICGIISTIGPNVTLTIDVSKEEIISIRPSGIGLDSTIIL